MKALVIVAVLGMISFIAMADETTKGVELKANTILVRPVGPNLEPIKFIPNLKPGK